MPRRGSYLFRRKGSPNWWLRLQFNSTLAKAFGRRKIERSLGTVDRTEAEVRAADEIKAHKALLILARNSKAGTIVQSAELEFAPDRIHHLEDGTMAVATETTVTFFDRSGARLRVERNQKIENVGLKPNTSAERAFLLSLQPQKKNSDDKVIEIWIKQRSINKHLAAEAWDAWNNFKIITNGKRLASCNKDDSRKLVAYYDAKGNSSRTISKKIGHLRAAVKLAIGERKLEYNPFADVVPRSKDALLRRWVPLTDGDMNLVGLNLGMLRTEDQILWHLLARTGMRLEEPFQIEGEHSEHGVRFVIVGRKTAASVRRIPLPAAVCEMVPSTITGPLFSGSAETSGKRIRYFLRTLGISWGGGTLAIQRRSFTLCGTEPKISFAPHGAP